VRVTSTIRPLATPADIPFTRFESDLPPLDVIAIPTLPALVPSLSSADFSAQLRPLLLRLDALEADPVWSRTRAAFDLHSAWLRPATVDSGVGESVEGILPVVLSFAQEREAKRPARPPVVLALHAPADVTPAQLQAALMGLVARHAALRTCFRHVAEDGHKKLVAFVKHAKQIDVASLLQVVPAGDAHELVTQQQALTFDLEKTEGPLFRVVLRLGSDSGERPMVVIAADRLVADAHSLHLIARELLLVRLNQFLAL
jgi:hypothetical protein